MIISISNFLDVAGSSSFFYRLFIDWYNSRCNSSEIRIHPDQLVASWRHAFMRISLLSQRELCQSINTLYKQNVGPAKIRIFEKEIIMDGYVIYKHDACFLTNKQSKNT